MVQVFRYLNVPYSKVQSTAIVNYLICMWYIIYYNELIILLFNIPKCKYLIMEVWLEEFSSKPRMQKKSGAHPDIDLNLIIHYCILANASIVWV